MNRGFKKIDPEKLKAYVKEHPDHTQKEMAEAFGCCNQAISKALRRCGITRKKKNTRYKEQKPEKVEAYLKEMEEFLSEKIAYVDESGIDQYLYRKYAYALRGETVTERIQERNFREPILLLHS